MQTKVLMPPPSALPHSISPLRSHVYSIALFPAESFVQSRMLVSTTVLQALVWCSSLCSSGCQDSPSSSIPSSCKPWIQPSSALRAMNLQLATTVGDTERLVARIAVAEAARDATARQLAALQGQLAAEHAARAQLQANAALQVRSSSCCRLDTDSTASLSASAAAAQQHAGCRRVLRVPPQLAAVYSWRLCVAGVSLDWRQHQLDPGVGLHVVLHCCAAQHHALSFDCSSDNLRLKSGQASCIPCRCRPEAAACCSRPADMPATPLPPQQPPA
jgi:hypothetical protein